MTSNTFTDDESRILSLLDATLLNPNATQEDIVKFCEKCKATNPASICVLPQWVKLVAENLKDSKISIATVLNFPFGEDSNEDVVEAAIKAVKDGATELDVVVPYDVVNYDEGFSIKTMIADVVEATPDILIKAIIETSALKTRADILKAAGAAASGGADFIKTSTGFHENGGATTEAVDALIDFITMYPGKVGLKISGSISTLQQAIEFANQAEDKMGAHWCHKKRFRIGSSKIVDEVQNIS